MGLDGLGTHRKGGFHFFLFPPPPPPNFGSSQLNKIIECHIDTANMAQIKKVKYLLKTNYKGIIPEFGINGNFFV